MVKCPLFKKNIRSFVSLALFDIFHVKIRINEVHNDKFLEVNYI